MSSLAKAEANWGPLSDMIVLWSPNHLKTLWKKSFPTPMVLMVFEQGMMITPFIRLWLTVTIMESVSVMEFVPTRDIPYIFLSLDRPPYFSINEFLASPDRHLDLSAFLPDFTFS